MKIGLIDVDGYKYPNLPLMKLSAYHKQQGDIVEWYSNLGGKYDIVYKSKVFSFTDDYKYPIHAKKVIKGGTGYCIKLVNGREIYNKENDTQLPDEIEHIYPDYSIYSEYTKDTAYGFLTRGCPRGCDFCHVKDKEGLCSRKVANLSEFWRGQKNIVLCDPNLIACKDWKSLLQQLIDSKAWIDINQGIDIRMMTEEKAEMIKQLKIKRIHFAWDRYEDKELIVPKFKMFRDITKFTRAKLTVFCLVNFNTTFEQDLERVEILKSLDYQPYVMIYDKEHIDRNSNVYKLFAWCNAPMYFNSCTFDEFSKNHKSKKVKHSRSLF